jgi:hypothetical protein
MSWHCPLNSMTTNYDMYLSFLYCFLRWFTKQSNRGTSLFPKFFFATLGLTYRYLHTWNGGEIAQKGTKTNILLLYLSIK